MHDRETRATHPAEVRAADTGVKVEGYAAIFNERTVIAGMWEEVIHPGAFDAALRRRDDVPFLIEHRGLPLARTASGTLNLTVDERGLKIASDLDPTDPDVMRIVPKMRRGDLSKMSFGFRAVRQEWDESKSLAVRHLHEVELLDVSVVADPAYEGTDIAIRSRQAALIKHAPGALVARIQQDLALRSRLLRA
jgi:HK97 family phage prohead protease